MFHNVRVLQRRRACAAVRPESRTAPARARSSSRAAAGSDRRRRETDSCRPSGRRSSAAAFPVATAAQTASADVGCSVARCITAPASRMRPKFGSRPSAVALVMKSSDPASMAMIVDARATARRARRSNATSSGCASSTGGVAAAADRQRRGNGAGRDHHEAAAPTPPGLRPQMRAQARRQRQSTRPRPPA